MITIILTYRNREIAIVKNCLNSLNEQSKKDFSIILVDYGSTPIFSEKLELLCQEYSFIQLIQCPFQGQLWNKARAINIALKRSKTPYVLVGDIDMIYSPSFIEKITNLKEASQVTYFYVGYLSKEESKQIKNYSEYKISHFSSFEATGITLFPIEKLLEINGYDEFYHGWGSEDTDVHNRLKHFGVTINYYDSEVLLLHQWHAKNYRSIDSNYPFHTHLEPINQKYLERSKELKKIKANVELEWGEYFNIKEYKNLDRPSKEIVITNEKNEFIAFLRGVLPQLNSCIKITVTAHPKYKEFKNSLKKFLGKKSLEFYDFKEANNIIIEEIISRYRQYPYSYNFDQRNESIVLTINFTI